MERIDDLQNGLKIIQDDTAFCFGTDAVVLSHFLTVKRGARVADLGTGTGIIPLLLSVHSKAEEIVGIEIQPHMADMARRSVALNGLEGKIRIFWGDLKEAPAVFGKSSFDAVVCNPPYGKAGFSLPGGNSSRDIARHEVCCTLADCVFVAAELLRPAGRAAFLCPAFRAAELISLFDQNRLTPKRLRTVHPRLDKKPTVILLEGVKAAREGLAFLPPLELTDGAGGMSKELCEIYQGPQNDQ